MANRRARVDSASAAVRIMQGSTREIAPPSHVKLTENDWPYWHSIIEEMPKVEWTDHQLEIAAFLARYMADLDQEAAALRREGSLVKTPMGKAINPRFGLVEKLNARILATRRSLSIHGRAVQGEKRDAAKRRGAAKDVETLLDDDLIPRLS